jgi:hypothetical protein
VNQPPRLKDESDQAWTLNSLAIAYDKTGQSRNAVGFHRRAGDMAEKDERRDNLAASLGNLAESQVLLGELKHAESNLWREIEIDRDIGEESDEAFGHLELGRLLAYIGRHRESDKELGISLDLYAAKDHEHGQCFVWLYWAIRALLMDEPKSSLKALDNARNFWQLDAEHDAPVERELVRILWLSGAAKRRLSDLAGAETDLNEALSRCRRIRLVEFEADILLEMAKLQHQKAACNNAELIIQAKGLTSEALDIADRCEYRLQQADIHNFLAEMALGENDKTAAIEHAQIAKERAYCDGPPHCYKKALDEAERMLANLRGR